MASYSDPPEGGRGRRDLTGAIIFLLLSILVLYTPEGMQNQVAAVFRGTLLRPFIMTQEGLAHARLRAEDTARLQAQLDSLATVLARQAQVVAENGRLHGLLGLRDRARVTFLPASVIRPGTVGSESMFLLDVGSEEGVRVGDPVIVRNGGIGLVGVIQHVRRGASIGLDWSHPEFRASAMTQDGRVYGIVEPRRGLFRELDRLLMNGTPYYEGIEPGTEIVTSGLGGVFPRGIPMGTVDEMAEQEGRWRKAYWLRPAVETGSITHVLVVRKDQAPEGIMELFQTPDDTVPPGPEGQARPPSRGPGGEGTP